MKPLWPFLIVASALVLCAYIHAYSTRYSHVSGITVIDYWTGRLSQRY